MLFDNYGYPTPLQVEGYTLDPNTEKVKSIPASESIPFGRVVAVVDPSQDYCQLPSANQLTLSANLVSGNTIDGNVIIKTFNPDTGLEDSVTLAMPQVTYTTSHANTIGLINASIQSVIPALVASINTVDVTNRTIYATSSNNVTVTLSGFVVNGGASQATVSYSFYGILKGIAVWTNRQPDTYGNRQYRTTDCVGVITQGRVIVKPVDATDVYSGVFVQVIDNGTAKRGMLRTTSDGGKAVPFAGNYQDKAIALGFNTIELNLP